MKVFNLCLATVLLLVPSSIFAQAEIHNVKVSGVPAFSYDLVNLAADDSSLSKLNVYLQIPYDELQFVKSEIPPQAGEEGHYKARYEISVIVSTTKGEQVMGKDWRQEAVAKSYEETNSREKFAVAYCAFDLAPGSYDLLLAVTDLDSKKSGQKKVRIHLKDFTAKPLSLGEVTYLQRPQIDSVSVEGISSNFMASINKADSIFYAYFEIYSNVESLPGQRDSLQLSYDILDSRNKSMRSRYWVREKQGFKTVEYLLVDTAKLQPGRYLLRVRVQEDGFKDSVVKPLVIHLVGMPPFITDLETAIEQLRYVAKSSEVNQLRKAPQEEKKKQFLKFWEDKDPTPGTAANELMDEYYRRVNYANEHFRASLKKDGWETDMGMIYIIFGPPNDVVRNPYNVGINPYGGREIWAYEIWDYYSLNARFVFVDYTGFGDYKLVTPLPSWYY